MTYNMFGGTLNRTKAAIKDDKYLYPVVAPPLRSDMARSEFADKN